MKFSGRYSPVRLATCAVSASLFAVSFFLLMVVSTPRHDHLSLASSLWATPWLMLLFLAPPVGGIAISLMAESRLRRGVKKNVWTEAELSLLRNRLELPVWKWIGMAAFALYIVLIVLNSNHAIFFYTMMFPLHTLMGLYHAVKPQTRSTGLLDGMPSAPINSERWGRTSHYTSAS